MHALTFYVPESHLGSVKQALFAVGAGKISHYDSCCWQTRGEGQYRPLEGSAPYEGQTGEVSHETEYKVEMVLADNLVNDVITALKQAHPYEEVAYSLWPLINPQ